jgi:hypothetical protein
MCFWAAASSENDHHELGLEYRFGARHDAVKRCPHPLDDRVTHPPLNLRDRLPGVALIPVPVEGLGRDPKLDDEVAGEVLRLGLAALLAPEAHQGGFIGPHDDAGVGAADEAAPAGQSSQRGAAGRICDIGIFSLSHSSFL